MPRVAHYPQSSSAHTRISYLHYNTDDAGELAHGRDDSRVSRALALHTRSKTRGFHQPKKIFSNGTRFFFYKGNKNKKANE